MLKPFALECSGCSFGYDKNPVLNKVSISVGKEKAVAIIGANGSGKSTFLRGIAGFAKCLSGKVKIAGIRITNMSPEQRQALGLIFVPQGGMIFRSLTGLEHLKLAIGVACTKKLQKSRIKWIQSLFPGLEDILTKYGRELSGGEKTWLALACGVIRKPSVLLLDEPSLSLSIERRELLFELIRNRFEIETTILLAEQRVLDAERSADALIGIEGGLLKLLNKKKLQQDESSVIKII